MIAPQAYRALTRPVRAVANPISSAIYAGIVLLRLLRSQR